MMFVAVIILAEFSHHMGFELTMVYRLAPSHPVQEYSRHIPRNHRLPASACVSTQLPPAIIVSTSQTYHPHQHTCLVLHFHPFFPSCGQRSPNVAFLASTIRVLIGFSRCISPTLASIHDVTAHPQPGESFRCSSSGLSPFSHPHIDSRQRKHFTLSGFSWDGRKKNPAAASCGALATN